MRLKNNFPIRIYREVSKRNEETGELTTNYCKFKNRVYGSISDIWFCDWIDIYGQQQILNQANNLNILATIRMYYNPSLYDLMEEEQVFIIKGTQLFDDNLEKMYRVAGSVTNIKGENRYMEFKVTRKELK
jgi:hypothetical protein